MQQIEASRMVLRDSQREKFPYRMKALGLSIIVDKHVFSPKHFYGWKTFTKSFPSCKNKTVLEIGCGTGVTAMYLAKHGAKKVLAVDINKHAVKNTEKNIKQNRVTNVEVRHSDIFSAVGKEEKFDIIYWNTPFMYQKAGYRYRSILEKGLFDPGYSLMKRFLLQAVIHLNTSGRVLVGMGDFGDVKRFKRIAHDLGYSIKLIAQEKSKEIHPVEFQLYSLKP